MISTAQGNDTIDGGGGNDTIYAGSGDDCIYIVGGTGGFIDAGSGNDTISISSVVSGHYYTIDGGDGFETIDIDFTGLSGGITWLYYNSLIYNELYSYSSYSAIHDVLLSGINKLQFYSYGYSGISYIKNIEQYDITGTDVSDLLFYAGGNHYIGGKGTDTFYWDLSEVIDAIVWDNDPSKTTTVQGVELSGLERLLIATGSGDDCIRNTKITTSDYIDTGAGNDTIEGGGDGDTINAGSGDDTISISSLTYGGLYVDGGSGFDSIDINLTGFTGSSSHNHYIPLSWSSLNSGSNFGSIHDTLVNGIAELTLSSADYRVNFSNIEKYNLTGTDCNDLLLYSGGQRYDGEAGTDTFYADWSDATDAIVWDNNPDSTVTIQGAELSGLERLLIATGSGDDCIRNTKITTSDYIDTGAGNDTIEAGGGNDTIHGGDGLDTAVFTGNFAEYSISYNSTTEIVTVADNVANLDGADVISAVENFKFADVTKSALDFIPDTVAPTIATFTPANATTGVVIGSNILLTFNEPIQKGSGTIAIHSGSATGTVVESYDTATSTNLTIAETTLTINPTADLANGTHYFITFDASSIKDLAGNSYPGTDTYDFTTAAASSVHDISGSVTFWKTGAAIADVSNTFASDSMTTGPDGIYQHLDMEDGTYTLTSEKVSGTAESNAIKANDALAALKIAVGMNPNADGSAVSPYQYLAADVNHDGQVKAADALNILKMAVKLSTAPEKEWLFVPESVGSESMSRTHVVWPESQISVTLDVDQELHLIGIVQGDVNGSWLG